MTQFVFVKFAFLETMYIVHSLNEMRQSVTKMLRHLEQKGYLQTSPDSQEEIWYKKKKTKKKTKKKQKLHPSQIRCCPLVHDTAAEQRCIMLDRMMDNFLLSW